MPYFRTSKLVLSSAMKRFTVLFDMGRSGSTSLLSPSNSFDVSDTSYSELTKLARYRLCYLVFQIAALCYTKLAMTRAITIFPGYTIIYSPSQIAACSNIILNKSIVIDLSNNRVKPHGILVSVSLMHYCTSTPDLSTSQSSTNLQVGYTHREVLSQGEFHTQMLSAFISSTLSYPAMPLA